MTPPRPPAARLTLALALAAAAAHAQPTEQPTEQPAEPSAEQDTPPPELDDKRAGPTLTLTLGGSFTAETDADDAPGELQITRARALLEAGFDLGDRRSLTIGLGAERSWYDFDGATTLDPSGDPFSRVTDAELFARYSAPLNDDTSWFALGSVGIAAEDGADLSESFVYSGAGGFVTQASPGFSWGLGVLVRTRLEDDPLIIPIPQIRWKIDERWTLESQRAGLRLDYRHSDALSYGVQGEYASRSFRLDEDGPLPDGMATDRRVPISVYADYTPTPAVTVTARVGAAVLTNIELLDRNGDKTADEDFDPGVFFGINARIAF